MDYSNKIFKMLNIEPNEEFWVEDENKNIVKIKIASNLLRDIHLTYVTDSFVGHNIILTEEEAKTKLKEMKKREDIL